MQFFWGENKHLCGPPFRQLVGALQPWAKVWRWGQLGLTWQDAEWQAHSYV